MVLEEVDIYIGKINPNSCLAPCTKINLRWIILLSIKARIIRLLEKRIREYFHDLGIDKDLNAESNNH